MTDQTSEQRFVEAMHGLACAGGTDEHRGHCIICVRVHSACEAFGDQACLTTAGMHRTLGEGCASCRARILKAVFGD